MIDEHQETVWFWYNPALSSVLQEEIAPYRIDGLFDSEGDAQEFLEHYADQYNLADTSHLELYEAEIKRRGHGRKHFYSNASGRTSSAPESVGQQSVASQQTLEAFTTAGGDH